MKSILLSLFVIGLLALSPASYAFTSYDNFDVDVSLEKNILENPVTDQQNSKVRYVFASASLNVSHTSIGGDEPLPESGITRSIFLDDHISIKSVNHEESFVVAINVTNDLAILERFDRTKKPTITTQNHGLNLNEVLTSEINENESVIPLSIPQIPNELSWNNLQLTPDTELIFSADIFDPPDIGDEQLVYQNIPIILLVVPLSGYLLLQSKQKIPTISSSKQFFCYAFVILLLSSGVITPLSISYSYWGMAFAQESDPLIDEFNTAIVDPSTSTSTDEFDTAIVDPGTSTSTEEFDSAIIDPGTSTSTEELEIIEPNPVEEEIILELGFDDEIFTNSTIPENDNFELVLDGDDDFITVENLNQTNSVTELTVSAWVKPDYSSGSPEFTVLSKADSFALSVNNHLPPQKSLVFSIFDGIKWTDVESTSEIPEEWTFVAATLYDTTISVYVNGELESTKELSGMPTLSENGKLVDGGLEAITSDADIVIGAYVYTKNELPKISDKFSGKIDDVSLDDTALTEDDLLILYQQDAEAYAERNIEITIDDLIDGLIEDLNLNSTGTNSTLIEPIELIEDLNLNSTGTNSTLIEPIELIEDLNLNFTSTNSTLIEPIELIETNSTALDVKPILKSMKKSFSLSETAEIEFEYLDDENALKAKNFKAGMPEKSVQNGKWKDYEDITVDLYDSQGNHKYTDVKIEKKRDGQFAIEIEPNNYKPGLYKVKTTLNIDGETFVVEDEFAWGLVSLNTNKSTYHPGETADFEIVVLNNQGNPVCNANLSMNIASPNSSITNLSSGNGITVGETCGLYEAKYNTSASGTYNIDIHATASGIDTDFETTFAAADFYEYDILRTAQSVIDPTINPNFFDVVIDIESFVGSGDITIVETIPSVLDVQTDADVRTEGDRKILTWTRSLDGNNTTSVSYTYSVPFVFPSLYDLGELQIQYGSGLVYTEARPWFVANDPLPSGFVDAESATGTTVSTLTTTNFLNIPVDTHNPVLVVVISSNPSTIAPTDIDILADGTSTVLVNDLAQITGAVLTDTANGANGRVSMHYATLLDGIPIGQNFDVRVNAGGTATDLGVGAVIISGLEQDNTAVSAETNTVFAVTTSNAADDEIITISTLEAGDAMVSGLYNKATIGAIASGTEFMALTGTDGHAAAYSVNEATTTETHSWAPAAGGTRTIQIGIELNAATTLYLFPTSGTVTVSDNVSVQKIVDVPPETLAPAATVSVADNVTVNKQERVVPLAPAATVSVADNVTATKLVIVDLAPAASVSVADNVTVNKQERTVPLAPAATVSVADNVSINAIMAVTPLAPAATVSVADNVTVNKQERVVPLAPAATVSVADNVTVNKQERTVPLAPAVSVSVADNVSIVVPSADQNRSATATVSVADNVTVNKQERTVPLAPAATVSVADNVTVNKQERTVPLAPAATVSVADNVSINAIMASTGIAPAASVSVADNVTVNKQERTVPLAPAATVSVADNVTINKVERVVPLAPAATVSVADNVTINKVENIATPAVSGSVTVADNVSVNKIERTETRSAAATVSVADNVSIQRIEQFVPLAPASTVSVADNVTINKVERTVPLAPAATVSVADNVTVNKQERTVPLAPAATVSVADNVTINKVERILPRSVSGSVSVADNVSALKLVIADIGVSGTVSVADNVTINKVERTETRSATATVSVADNVSAAKLLLSNASSTVTVADNVTVNKIEGIQTRLLSNSISMESSVIMTVLPDDSTAPIIIIPSDEVDEIIVEDDNTEIQIPKDGFEDEIILTIDDPEVEDVSLDLSREVVENSSNGQCTSKDFIPDTDYTLQRNFNEVIDYEVITNIESGTTITGSCNWDETFDHIDESIINVTPTVTTTTIAGRTVTTTTTFEPELVIKLGGDEQLLLDKPVRIEFANLAAQGLTGFVQEEGGSPQSITTSCDADSSTTVDAQLAVGEFCATESDGDFVIWTKTLSRFGVHKASSSTSSSGGGDGSGGHGNTGVNTSGLGFGASYGGVLASPLLIHEVSYDVCDANIATILVSSDSEIYPEVKLHTTKLGTIKASMAEIQPYEELNKITKIDKLLYEVSVAPDETFFMVSVTEEHAKPVPRTVQTAVNIDQCTGGSLLADIPDEQFEEIDPTVPQIFDVKVQIEDGIQYLASQYSSDLYVDNESITVSAIVNSETPIKRAEIRIAPISDSVDDYIALGMEHEVLPISDSIYYVSTTVPAELISDPAINYWIHVINEELDEQESKSFVIGSKPVSDISAQVEIDLDVNKSEGSIIRPKAFVYNEESEPVYGKISLVSDNQSVFTHSQLFVPGENEVTLEWKTPKVGKHMSYAIKAELDLYGDITSTQIGHLNTYDKTISTTLSQIDTVESIIDENGNLVAIPAMLYSSNADKNMNFRVLDAHGHCIIGTTDECEVQESTYGKRGGLQSVEHEGQIYRIKYSGPDNALERFSITSIDPLDGNWSIAVESTDDFMQQAHAMKDVSLKIKYRTINDDTTLSSR